MGRRGMTRRTIVTFLNKFLLLFILGSIIYAFYLMIQDLVKGTLNVYSYLAYLIGMGIFSSIYKRYAFIGCVVTSVTTLYFFPFIMFDIYLEDFPLSLSVILSTVISLILAFIPHIILRKRVVPMIGKTFSISVGYVITVLFLFSLTGRAGIPSWNLKLLDLFALLILVYVYNIALNETYRAEVVRSKTGMNPYDVEIFTRLGERLQKRFPRMDTDEIGATVYMVRSATEFFVHGDFNKSIVESYRTKEGLQRVLSRFDEKKLSTLVDKKCLKELDKWRAKITHSGIPTKREKMMKRKNDKKDISSYEKSLRSLNLISEILEKIRVN